MSVKWLAPKTCRHLLERSLFPLGLLALACLAYGIPAALVWSPPDYQQGEAVRIMYVHVPCAIGSLACYTLMALFSFLYLVFHIKVADAFARACVGPGCVLTLLALITGSLWGKPMWGTYWVWDARLTSELILFFLFLGVLLLRTHIENPKTAARASGLLTLVGVIDIPIIHFSVVWWNSLHQPSTLLKSGGPSMSAVMLWPLLAMLFGIAFYVLYCIALGALTHLARHEREARTYGI